MKPSVALEKHREAVRAAFLRHPTIANPRVFGSVLHGDDTDESDLDLLVDALPGTSLFTLGGLQEELRETLGVPVDVVVAKELNRRIKGRVLAEAKPLIIWQTVRDNVPPLVAMLDPLMTKLDEAGAPDGP